MAVSYATLCETQTLILRRLGGAYARQWPKEMLDGAALLNAEPADYFFAAAHNWSDSKTSQSHWWMPSPQP